MLADLRVSFEGNNNRWKQLAKVSEDVLAQEKFYILRF